MAGQAESRKLDSRLGLLLRKGEGDKKVRELDLDTAGLQLCRLRQVLTFSEPQMKDTAALKVLIFQ